MASVAYMHHLKTERPKPIPKRRKHLVTSKDKSITLTVIKSFEHQTSSSLAQIVCFLNFYLGRTYCQETTIELHLCESVSTLKTNMHWVTSLRLFNVCKPKSWQRVLYRGMLSVFLHGSLFIAMSLCLVRLFWLLVKGTKLLMHAQLLDAQNKNTKKSSMVDYHSHHVKDFLNYLFL